MSDDERRANDLIWRGEVTQILKDQSASHARLESYCARIETHVKETNGRVTKLEDKEARNAWLVKVLGAIGLGGAAKAFMG